MIPWTRAMISRCRIDKAPDPSFFSSLIPIALGGANAGIPILGEMGLERGPPIGYYLAMRTLYHMILSPHSRKIRLVLGEKGLAFELRADESGVVGV